jgi:protein transport protein SEC61 subunit alpha
LEVKFIFYSACALFSKTWIEFSGQGPDDVARSLKKDGMFLKGHTDEGTRNTLTKYIPIAATFGGMCIGALTIIADFLGAIGSGTGILLAVTIIYGYVEEFKKQKESIF